MAPPPPTPAASTKDDLPSQQWKVLVGPLAFLVANLIFPLLFERHAAFSGAAATFGLLIWMAWWWISEALPLAVTALLPLAILPFFGAMPAREVAPNYFNDTIALFFGGFCLALALEYTSLHRRLISWPLRLVKGRAKYAIGVMLFASAMLSMWVSNTATTLALLPIALALAGTLDPEKKTELSTRVVLAVAFGAAIGGIGTVIGTPPNAFLQAFYNTTFEAEIASGSVQALSFGRWMTIGIPVVALLLPCALVLLTRGVSQLPEPESVESPEIKVEAFTAPQKVVMGVFLLTVAAWVTRAPIEIGSVTIPLTGWGSSFPTVSDGTISMSGALLLFALGTRPSLRILPWKWAAQRLPWGALLLFGGGLALAAGMKTSGLVDLIFNALSASGVGIEQSPQWLIVLVILVIMTLFSEFSSNTAAAAIALPLLASLGIMMDAPLLLMVAGTLGASCGYALPVATPPNTIAYATGVVSAREMIRYGLILDICAVGVMFLVITFVL